MIKSFLASQLEGLGSWILTGVVHGIINVSYPLCLSMGLVSLILYLVGIKKYAKLIPASVLIYYCIQCLKIVI